jgi:hypothetical protein
MSGAPANNPEGLLGVPDLQQVVSRGVFNSSGKLVRTCTMPAGTTLVVAVVDVDCSTLEAPPFPAATKPSFGTAFAASDGSGRREHEHRDPRQERPGPAGTPAGTRPNQP